jgi:hypothetical protein
MGLPLVERLSTRNGGIPVRLLTTAGPGRPMGAHPPQSAGYDAPHQEEEEVQ